MEISLVSFANSTEYHEQCRMWEMNTTGPMLAWLPENLIDTYMRGGGDGEEGQGGGRGGGEWIGRVEMS